MTSAEDCFLQTQLGQVRPQILTFVLAQYPQRQADQCPQMNGVISAFEMFAQIVNLGMTVVAGCDAVGRFGFSYLIKLSSAVVTPGFGIAGLQESAAATATIIVGSVGLHVNKVFLAHNRSDHKTQVLGNRIAQSFPDKLARVLHCELHFQIFVPVGIDFELALSDPLGIVFDDAFGFKVMLYVELFQSDPDCEKFMPSLGIEPDLAPEIIHGFGFGSHYFFPAVKILTEQAVVLSGPAL